MRTEYLIFLGLALAAGLVMMKYLYWQIGWQLRERARLEQDPQLRREKIAELETLLKQKPQDAEARLLRATLLYQDGNFAAAAEDLEQYLVCKPADSEGWAELGECRLCLRDAPAAEEAARRAIALDPHYADYRMLLVRAHLLAQKPVAAEEVLLAWTALDEERLNRPAEPRSWFSPPKQIPEGEPVSDPALRIYGAAIRLAVGDIFQAQTLLAEVRRTHPDYTDQLLQTDPLLQSLSQL